MFSRLPITTNNKDNSMRVPRLLALLSLVLLTGCVGSPLHNALHPDRQFYEKDGHHIVVLKQPDHWAAWYDGKKLFYFVPNLNDLKPIQVEAIEHISGCKVLDARHFMNGQPAYLMAHVICPDGTTL